LAANGAELLGPLPTELQYYIPFTAAVSSHAEEPAVSKEFIRFLKGSIAAQTIKAKGIEPD
jgi:ABC-type molybdate transport system substrate-binding protein